jgi:urease accessory protein
VGGIEVRLVRNICMMAMIPVFIPSMACAHLVTSGLGPFYDGSLHLLLSPSDLLGLVAATLLAGLRGARAGRLTVVALPAAWFIAGLIGLNLPFIIDLPGLSILSFVILGVLVAIHPKLPPVAVTALTGLYGVLHGLLNGSALGVMGAGVLSLFGIVVTVLIIALLVSATVVSLRAVWTRIAVRVVGSWVAAVGMLMFGWMIRGSV